MAPAKTPDRVVNAFLKKFSPHYAKLRLLLG